MNTATGATPMALTYSTRGELLSESVNGSNVFQQQSADGYLVSQNTTSVSSFDARSSAPLGTVSPVNTVTYDVSGRQTRSLFDVQNRVIQPGGGSLLSYAWGPNDHPIFSTVADGSVQHTYHWSGDNLLFSSDKEGRLEDVKPTSFSDIFPQPSGTYLQVIDFDPFGEAASQHNASGHAAWTAPNLQGACGGTQIEAASAGYTSTGLGGCNQTTHQGILYRAWSDGYYDGYEVIRGVRAYNADMNAWSSPDALTGTQSNPLTQLSYSYADNNPGMFKDPSGYSILGGIGKFLGGLIVGVVGLVGGMIAGTGMGAVTVPVVGAIPMSVIVGAAGAYAGAVGGEYAGEAAGEAVNNAAQAAGQAIYNAVNQAGSSSDSGYGDGIDSSGSGDGFDIGGFGGESGGGTGSGVDTGGSNSGGGFDAGGSSGGINTGNAGSGGIFGSGGYAGSWGDSGDFGGGGGTNFGGCNNHCQYHA
jgi:hypothetical protein